MRNVMSLLMVLMMAAPAAAQLWLPGIFGDHMVLQRNKPIRVWGEASPGEQISVTLAGQSVKTKAAKDRSWQVYLPAMTHGGPHTLTVKSKSGELSFNDVLVGEVWLCSGQSNMEWTVQNADSAEKEINQAGFPMIRHLQVPKATSLSPEKNIKPATWQICSPETVGNFTAVGYFFARELYRQLDVPIGLVNSSWGGTHVETWTSGPAFFSEPDFAGLKSKMPASQDALITKRKLLVDEQMKKIQNGLPSAEETRTFSAAGLDDRSWATMKIPGLWEGQGLANFDGEIWFRTRFPVPADLRLADMRIELGMIDDVDSTYINGKFIGSTRVYNRKRVYPIPAGLLTNDNSLAVKVMDSGGGGGIYGDPADLAVHIGNVRIPLAGNWSTRIEKVYNDGNFINPNSYPTLLFNAMINPIAGFGMHGAIWYQGESNAGRAEQYNTSFPLMISDWRRQWKDSFPFYFVQLTHWKASGGTSQNGGSEWAELREAQQHTLQLPYTGMAVITDIGNTEDIHPRNKQDVGKRLALQALSKTYDLPVRAESPAFSSFSVREGKALLEFKHVYDGWQVRNKYGYINGFEVAGSDQQFHYAKAWIENGRVIVFSEKVTQPVAIRYCWSDDPNDVNLFNSEGLPAAPFRTDQWPGKTRGIKFDID